MMHVWTFFYANKFDNSRLLLKEMEALIVYQINIIQTLKFMSENTEL